MQTSSNPDSFVATYAPYIVSSKRNPRFTGRETQLAELKGRLLAMNHTSKIAIKGLGGVGKTQLLLELLYRTKEKHKDYSIILEAIHTTTNACHDLIILTNTNGQHCGSQDGSTQDNSGNLPTTGDHADRTDKQRFTHGAGVKVTGIQ